MSISQKQIALIHIAAKQLGLTRDEYESILKTHGGVESSKLLNGPGLERVMQFLAQLGFKKQPGKRKVDLSILATVRQRKLLVDLAEDLGWRAARLCGFAERMTGKQRPEELTRKEAQKVIEGMKAMRDRKVHWN